MINDNDTIICLLDVLGFENLFNKYGLDEIENKYKELLAVADEQNIEVAIAPGPGGVVMAGSPGIKSTYFSDTIIFWCKYDDFRMSVLFGCMCELLCKSIEIGLPLRGSFGVGQMRIDKEKGIYLGQPIITATRAETAQKWIGITLSKSFNVEPYNGGFRIDTILQYEKHLKVDGREKVIPLAMDFPRHWRQTRKTSLVDEIQKLNLDETFADYYNNTIDFVNHSADNHDWWKKLPEYKIEMERREKESASKLDSK